MRHPAACSPEPYTPVSYTVLLRVLVIAIREKLTVALLLTKFQEFYEIQKFTTMRKTASHSPYTEPNKSCLQPHILFFGAFVKLRKTTTNLVMPACLPACLPVRPSVRMENFGSHWTNFHEI
jgi:hypothetical protein